MGWLAGDEASLMVMYVQSRCLDVLIRKDMLQVKGHWAEDIDLEPDFAHEARGLVTWTSGWQLTCIRLPQDPEIDTDCALPGRVSRLHAKVLS